MKNISGFSRMTIATLLVSGSSAFGGYWEGKTGAVSVPNNTAITEGDKPSAEVTKITVGYGITLWITNLTTKWEMTTPISGSGKLRIKNCSDNLIVNADNRDYIGAAKGQRGCFAVEDAATTVIVSNRYGLGSSSFQKAATAASANSFKFGGAGLTNDVAITGGTFAPQWPDETGTFVQNASLQFNSFKFRNAEVSAGALGDSNTSSVQVEPGCLLTLGTNVHVWASTSTSGAALNLSAQDSVGQQFLWGTAQTNSYRLLQIMGKDTKIVCNGINAFKTSPSLNADMGYVNVHNKTVNPTLDLNGYDQELPWISTYSISKDARLLITSAVPATVTFTCRSTGSSGDLVFCGAASFCYAGVDGSKYTLFNRYLSNLNGKSQTSGKLSVRSGTLVYGSAGEQPVTWFGREIEASGTGTLQLTKMSRFGYTDEKGTKACQLTIRDSAKVDIAAGETIEVGYLTAGETQYRKGTYGSQEACEAGLVDQDYVVPELTGTGLLKVLRSPVRGLSILIR